MVKGVAVRRNRLRLWHRRALRTGRALAFLEFETKNKNNVLLLLVKVSITKFKYMQIILLVPENDRLCLEIDRYFKKS